MRKRFTPSITGDWHTHQARIQSILQIAHENAVLDQNRALRRIAFIIHLQRAAPVSNRAIVNYRNTRGCYPFTNAAGKSGAAFTVEITLQAVPHSLMQQNTRPAGTEHHSHITRWRGLGIQINNCLMYRLGGVIV